MKKRNRIGHRKYRKKRAKYNRIIKQNQQGAKPAPDTTELEILVQRKPPATHASVKKELHWAEKLAIVATVTQALGTTFHLFFPAIHFYLRFGLLWGGTFTEVCFEVVGELVIGVAGLGQAFGIPSVGSARQRDEGDVLTFKDEALCEGDGVFEEHDLILHALDDHKVIFEAGGFKERGGFGVLGHVVLRVHHGAHLAGESVEEAGGRGSGDASLKDAGVGKESIGHNALRLFPRAASRIATLCR